MVVRIAVRRAARRARADDVTGRVLVCMRNEQSALLKDDGDERGVSLHFLRALASELARISQNRRGRFSAGEVQDADMWLCWISNHLGDHGMRLGRD